MLSFHAIGFVGNWLAAVADKGIDLPANTAASEGNKCCIRAKASKSNLMKVKQKVLSSMIKFSFHLFSKLV